MSQPITYQNAGVNIAAMTAALGRMKQDVRSTFTPGVVSDMGSFGGMFALGGVDCPNPVLVASIDGVGTKLKVAFLTGRHDTIGADLVNHCVNDILVQGARPLFFLDYFSTGRLDQQVLCDVVSGIAKGCRETGCALLGGETAEMPGMYADGEYDLAGTIVGVVDRERALTGASIQSGDTVIGLASVGLHTNGYSLARKVLLDYAGMTVDSQPPELGGQRIGDSLLAPHRCYLNPILPLLGDDLIRGLAHITGGGLLDNIPRILPEGLGVEVQKGSWPILPIFELIASRGNVPEEDLYRTLNMGIGMVAIASPVSAKQVISRLSDSGEQAFVIGKVVEGESVVTLI